MGGHRQRHAQGHRCYPWDTFYKSPGSYLKPWRFPAINSACIFQPTLYPALSLHRSFLHHLRFLARAGLHQWTLNQPFWLAHHLTLILWFWSMTLTPWQMNKHGQLVSVIFSLFLAHCDICVQTLYMPTEQHRRSYWRKSTLNNCLGEKYRPSINSENKSLLFFGDNYRLVKAELVGGGIIWVEFKLDEVGQKTINVQSLEIDWLVHFSGGWRSA